MSKNLNTILYSAKNSLFHCIVHDKFEHFELVTKEIQNIIVIDNQNKKKPEYDVKIYANHHDRLEDQHLDLSINEKSYTTYFFQNHLLEVCKQLDSPYNKISDGIATPSLDKVFNYYLQLNLVTPHEALFVCFVLKNEQGKLGFSEQIINFWKKNVFLLEEDFKKYYENFYDIKSTVKERIKEIDILFQEQEAFYLYNRIHSHLENKDSSQTRRKL